MGRAHRPPPNAQLRMLPYLDETNKHCCCCCCCSPSSFLFFLLFLLLLLWLFLLLWLLSLLLFKKSPSPESCFHSLCMPLEKRIKDTKHVGLQTRLASCSQDQGEYLAFQMEKREKRNQHLLHQVANPERISL